MDAAPILRRYGITKITGAESEGDGRDLAHATMGVIALLQRRSLSSITLDHTLFARWCADPIAFVEEVLRDPESGLPFKLLAAERDFLAHAFELDGDGRLRYPEQVYAAPKKSGKTAFAALHLLTTCCCLAASMVKHTASPMI